MQEQYPDASKITLVMVRTEACTRIIPETRVHFHTQARELVERGRPSMAECKFSILARQCLDRRIAKVQTTRGKTHETRTTILPIGASRPGVLVSSSRDSNRKYQMVEVLV